MTTPIPEVVKVGERTKRQRESEARRVRARSGRRPRAKRVQKNRLTRSCRNSIQAGPVRRLRTVGEPAPVPAQRTALFVGGGLTFERTPRSRPSDRITKTAFLPSRRVYTTSVSRRPTSEFSPRFLARQHPNQSQRQQQQQPQPMQ